MKNAPGGAVLKAQHPAGRQSSAWGVGTERKLMVKDKHWRQSPKFVENKTVGNKFLPQAFTLHDKS